MKILEANAGALTNFEVLNFLRSRGAGKDPTRVIAAVAQSEFKVYDYLEQSAGCNQTREIINEFLEKSKKYDLAKAEILNIINIRPSSLVEIDPTVEECEKCLNVDIVEECEKRFGDAAEELVETVVQVLPPPPNEMESDEGNGEEKEDGKE